MVGTKRLARHRIAHQNRCVRERWQLQADIPVTGHTDLDTLAKVPGIGTKTAVVIYEALHPK